MKFTSPFDSLGLFNKFFIRRTLGPTFSFRFGVKRHERSASSDFNWNFFYFLIFLLLTAQLNSTPPNFVSIEAKHVVKFLEMFAAFADVNIRRRLSRILKLNIYVTRDAPFESTRRVRPHQSYQNFLNHHKSEKVSWCVVLAHKCLFICDTFPFDHNGYGLREKKLINLWRVLWNNKFVKCFQGGRDRRSLAAAHNRRATASLPLYRDFFLLPNRGGWLMLRRRKSGAKRNKLKLWRWFKISI